MTWFQKCWHWPNTFEQGMLPNSKSKAHIQSTVDTNIFLGFFVVYQVFQGPKTTNTNKTHKQIYTITIYGSSEQSENVMLNGK